IMSVVGNRVHLLKRLNANSSPENSSTAKDAPSGTALNSVVHWPHRIVPLSAGQKAVGPEKSAPVCRQPRAGRRASAFPSTPGAENRERPAGRLAGKLVARS